MAAAIQKALYLKQLEEDFGIQPKYTIAIGEDNQRCIKLCLNPVILKRSKKIEGQVEAKFDFIRNKTDDGSISIHYVITFLVTKWQPTSLRNPYRSEVGNLWNCFDGNRLYAMSSSPSWVSEIRSNYTLQFV